MSFKNEAMNDFKQRSLARRKSITINKVNLHSKEHHSFHIGVDGIDFERAWENKVEGIILGVKTSIISLKDLMLNKSSTDRHKDKLDMVQLKDLYEKKNEIKSTLEDKKKDNTLHPFKDPLTSLKKPSSF